MYVLHSGGDGVEQEPPTPAEMAMGTWSGMPPQFNKQAGQTGPWYMNYPQGSIGGLVGSYRQPMELSQQWMLSRSVDARASGPVGPSGAVAQPRAPPPTPHLSSTDGAPAHTSSKSTRLDKTNCLFLGPTGSGMSAHLRNDRDNELFSCLL